MSDLERPDRVEEILSDDAVWAEPPGELEPSLMSAIKAEGPDQEAARGGDRRSWWPIAVAAGIIAVIGMTLLLQPFGGDSAPSAVFALSGDGLGGEAEVGAAGAGWWIRLHVEGMPPAPEGKYYEGWVSNDADIVSIGTFHMRDGDSVELWSGVPMREFPQLVVTLQEVGAGTGPSAEVVLTGRLEG